MTRQEYEDFCEKLKSVYNKKTGNVISTHYYEYMDTTVIIFNIKGKL